ncbi:MAG: NAD(P)/FAD-dependent oxidoreductase [Ginsengibacter sp.]
MNKKLLVIGGGAAGFFCAINAAESDPELRVVMVEKHNKLLSKVRISGGGRCNVTHACFSISEMIKNYPRGGNFLKKAFHRFFTNDTIQWFEKRGVVLKTEADGRMFPVTNSSSTIIDCLMKELNRCGIEIFMNKEVKHINFNQDKFEIEFADSSLSSADYVCVACGGYSKPTQFAWLQPFGHAIEPPVPSLFTFNIPGDPIKELMGISVEDVSIRIIGTNHMQRGPVLITHWGLSGPAVLKLSAFAAIDLFKLGYSFTITVNWVPGYNEQTARDKLIGIRTNIGSLKVVSKNSFFLPQRLWKYLIAQSGIHEEMRWADLPAKSQNKLVKNLTAQEFSVKGKTTFKEEFVTAGGIDLAEIDATSMESKIVPGLFFAGEIMNADGITGGFNFQHAWTSGWIAGKNIAERSRENNIPLQGSAE